MGSRATCQAGQMPRDSGCGPSTEEGLVQPGLHYLTLRQLSLLSPGCPQPLGPLPCPRPLTKPGSLTANLLVGSACDQGVSGRHRLAHDPSCWILSQFPEFHMTSEALQGPPTPTSSAALDRKSVV